MDKNKGHIDAKEFFRLMDADTSQHRDLDEFDLEALEGWKLVKDRAKAKEITDTNVDKKLEELLAEDKDASPLLAGDQPEKKRSKPGMYILSIAASLVLLFGLFFVFKGFNKQEGMADKQEVTGTSGKDLAAPAPPLEEKLKETNSDGSVVTEKGPGYKADANKPLPLEQQIANKKEAEYFSYSAANGDTMKLGPPIQAEVTELEVASVTEEKNLDYRKSDEPKFKAADVKGKTTEATKNPEVKSDFAKDRFDTDGTTEIALADKSNVKKEEKREEDKKVKSRAVLKKQSSNEGYVAAGAPPSMNDDQKVPAQMLDSVSPKTSVATNSGAATLTQSNANNVTVTIPGGNINTYTWTNATGGTKPANLVEAEFNGGKTALDAYIKQNLKIPESWKSEEVIIVKFLIDAKGVVSKPKIMSKTGNCPDCEKEAIRFVKAMPAWIAAKQDGKEVSSYKTITLSFKK